MYRFGFIIQAGTLVSIYSYTSIFSEAALYVKIYIMNMYSTKYLRTSINNIILS